MVNTYLCEELPSQSSDRTQIRFLISIVMFAFTISDLFLGLLTIQLSQQCKMYSEIYNADKHKYTRSLTLAPKPQLSAVNAKTRERERRHSSVIHSKTSRGLPCFVIELCSYVLKRVLVGYPNIYQVVTS